MGVISNGEKKGRGLGFWTEWLTLTFSSEDKDPVTSEDLEFVVLGGRHHLNDRERNYTLRIWLLQQSKQASYKDPPVTASSALSFRELIFDISQRTLTN